MTREYLRLIRVQLNVVAHDDDPESRFIYTALLVELRRHLRVVDRE